MTISATMSVIGHTGSGPGTFVLVEKMRYNNKTFWFKRPKLQLVQFKLESSVILIGCCRGSITQERSHRNQHHGLQPGVGVNVLTMVRIDRNQPNKNGRYSRIQRAICFKRQVTLRSRSAPLLSASFTEHQDDKSAARLFGGFRLGTLCSPSILLPASSKEKRHLQLIPNT